MSMNMNSATGNSTICLLPSGVTTLKKVYAALSARPNAATQTVSVKT